jgi:hypothetical protein
VWRKGYLTVQEAALSCHSNGHMLHSHFLATGFIKPLSLKKTFLINLEDATKIAHHLKTYTCPSWLAREYNYPLMKIVRLIESGGIQPLIPGNSNFIEGRITIPRSEAENIMTLHISKKYDTNLQNENLFSQKVLLAFPLYTLSISPEASSLSPKCDRLYPPHYT